MRKQYVDKLVGMLKTSGLDAVLICPSEELKFLTGFTPMMCERFQAMFLKKDGTLFYLCNLLYGDQMRKMLNNEIPVYTWFDGDGMTAAIKPILAEQGLLGCSVGVNSSAQAFNILEIADHMEITFKNAKPLLEELRIRKTAAEQQSLRRAAAIADAAYEPVTHFIKPGQKEAEIRDFLFRAMQKNGGTKPWAIVASGPNSSFPHYSEFERTIEKGDAIVLDYGCEFQEMQSDMSRTVFVGSVSEEQRTIYDLVDRAQLAAQTAAVEGAWIPDVDQAARTVLDEQGYAKTLINRVGHGIGYMMHEAPDLKQCNPRRLERGMAFSIEPGAYFPNRYGIRIENIVLINDKGETEILNQARRDLIVTEG